MVRLIEKYREDVAPAMKSQFGYSSTMAIPKISKVVIKHGGR